MCKLPNYMAWCIMRLVYFCPIYTACGLALVCVAGQAVYMVLVCVGHLGRESVSVFDGFVYL